MLMIDKKGKYFNFLNLIRRSSQLLYDRGNAIDRSLDLKQEDPGSRLVADLRPLSTLIAPDTY